MGNFRITRFWLLTFNKSAVVDPEFPRGGGANPPGGANICLSPATKLGQGYVFTHVCDSVHRGVVSRHALQVVSQHAFQVSRPKPRGKLRDLALGDLQIHSWGREYPSMHWGRPPPPHTHGYCCGRYASYSNAFLFCHISPKNKMKWREFGPRGSHLLQLFQNLPHFEETPSCACVKWWRSNCARFFFRNFARPYYSFSLFTPPRFMSQCW